MILQTAITMASLLENVTTLVTAAISWISSFVGAITSSPLLLLFVIVAFVGLGLGLIRRIIRL